MKDWGFFEQYNQTINKRMPEMGEGETMGSQIATAVNKLVYKWYNDGDVFDNTGALQGWCNDLSSYANWLFENVDEAGFILSRIKDCYDGSDYEDLLADLAEITLDEDFLEEYDERPKQGSIYDCAGPFRFEEPDEEEEEWEEEEWEEEEDEE